jgi:hypothetical protein
MTRAEAFRDLGLEPGAKPDDIRRAYLRGVKTRKPEVDPEGFRRLREAFELLSANAQPSREAPPASTAPTADVRRPAPVDPRAAWMADLVAALRAEPDLEQSIRRLRQAIREEPAIPDLRWWLVRDLLEAKRPREAAEALRQGDAAGLPGFLRELARGFPDLLTPPEMERLAQSDDPETLAALAEAHARRGDAATAATLCQRAFQLADVQGDLAHPTPQQVIRILLLLQGQGAFAASLSLQGQLHWRMASGRMPRVPAGEQAALWALVCELHELSTAFHQGARKAIAVAALAGDPGAAVRPVWQIARGCGEQSRRYAEMLQPLPILNRLFYDIFLRAAPEPAAPAPVQPPPVQQQQTVRWTVDPRAVVIAVAVLFLYGLIFFFTDALKSPPSPAAPAATATAPEPAASGASLVPALLAACPRDRLTADLAEPCRQARAALDALRSVEPDCTAAKAALYRMRANGIPRQGPLSDLAAQLSAAYHERCP